MRFIVEEEKITAQLEFGNMPISPQTNFGYRPFELFVSSLIGCSGSILRNLLNKKRISFSNLFMEVTSVRNPDKANRIEQLSILASCETSEEINEEQGKKIAALVVKNCGMIQSVIDTIDIEFIVKFTPIHGDKS